MTNAREQLAMRNQLNLWLRPDEIRAIHWTPLLNASADAIARGWTGDEIARMIIGDLGGKPADNVGAVATTTLRRLGQTDPPRDVTPTPPDIAAIRQERAQAAAAARNVDHAEHIRAIRAAIRQ